MKNNIIRLTAVLFTALLLGSTFQSCKKRFDEPPVEEFPSIIPNATISQIKAIHTVGNTPTLITDSLVVEGIVVSSDEAGNFFKQLIIQDDSAGIELRIEMSNLYTDYPVGRKVWVKCKDLYVGDYEGNHQLTINDAGDRIPEGMLSKFLIGGPKDQPVVPKAVSILDIKSTTKYRNMLVELDNVQFATADSGQTYADAVTSSSLNRSIQDCNGNAIILRSSGYATFASDLTPGGNGKAVGIHTNFGTDAQLYIRDTEDLGALNSTRCTVSVGGNLISISTLRAAFGGSVPANSKINAYVISDRTTGNIVGQNMVIMDASAGITVRFTSAHNFNEGDQVEIPLDGATISEFNGLMQLEGIPSGSVTVVSTGNAVPPTIVTVSDLLANAETYESSLIKVVNAGLSGSSTYSGTLDLTDGTGTIDLFSRFTSTFASNPVPCGTLEVVGIMGQFTTYQVQLRDPAVDVTGGTPCGSGATLANIQDVRAQYSGVTGTVSGSLKIRGIVISDRANSNIVSQNAVIQDSLGFGVTVRFTANHTLNLGDKVEINITGATLEEFSGLLQVSQLGTTTSTVVSTGNSVTPRVATLAQINTNSELWESTLVRVDNISSITSGGPTFGSTGGNLVVSDGSGSITIYTRTAATFSSSTVPATPFDVIGILGQFNTTKQISARNAADIIP
jgi:hypothetical protein